MYLTENNYEAIMYINKNETLMLLTKLIYMNKSSYTFIIIDNLSVSYIVSNELLAPEGSWKLSKYFMQDKVYIIHYVIIYKKTKV